MRSFLPTLHRIRRGSRRALGLTLTAAGLPPSRIREKIAHGKARIKGRVRAFVLPPPEELWGSAPRPEGELQQFTGQVEVLRQQLGAARLRIAQLEANEERVVRLVEEVTARLRMLDVKQLESFAQLRGLLNHTAHVGPKVVSKR